MELMLKLIWICPALFVAGIVDSVAGGGGLIAFPAYMMTGMPIHFVYGCNKLQSGVGTAMSAYRYYKNKLIDIKLALISAVMAVCGSFMGTRLVLVMPERVLYKLLSIMLPAIALFFIVKRIDSGHSDKKCALTLKNMELALAIGLAAGLYDGVFGPGGGTIVMMAFTLLLKYDMRVASGNAKIVILVSNLIALTQYLISGSILFSIAIPAAVANLCGSFVGSELAAKKGAKVIRPMMMFVMSLLVVKIFTML